MIKKIVLLIFCVPLTMHAMQITQQEREHIVTKLDELTQQRLTTVQELTQKLIDWNNSEATIKSMQDQIPQLNVKLENVTNLCNTIEKLLQKYINPPVNYKDKLDEAGLLKRLDQTVHLDKKVFDLINESNKQADTYSATINELVQQIYEKLAQAAQQEQSTLNNK